MVRPSDLTWIGPCAEVALGKPGVVACCEEIRYTEYAIECETRLRGPGGPSCRRCCWTELNETSPLRGGLVGILRDGYLVVVAKTPACSFLKALAGQWSVICFGGGCFGVISGRRLASRSVPAAVLHARRKLPSHSIRIEKTSY